MDMNGVYQLYYRAIEISECFTSHYLVLRYVPKGGEVDKWCVCSRGVGWEGSEGVRRRRRFVCRPAGWLSADSWRRSWWEWYLRGQGSAQRALAHFRCWPHGPVDSGIQPLLVETVCVCVYFNYNFDNPSPLHVFPHPPFPRHEFVALPALFAPCQSVQSVAQIYDLHCGIDQASPIHEGLSFQQRKHWGLRSVSAACILSGCIFLSFLWWLWL